MSSVIERGAPFASPEECRAAGAHWLIVMDEPGETVLVQALTELGRIALTDAGVPMLPQRLLAPVQVERVASIVRTLDAAHVRGAVWAIFAEAQSCRE